MFLRILYFILCYDVWFYISHVVLHSKNFWLIHKEHHTKTEPRFLDTYVGHWLETVFQSVGYFFPILFTNYTWTDAIVALCFLNVRGMMRHDDRCVPLIGNHHLLHHKHPNYNFGEYWMDTLCGTRYPIDQEYRRGWLYL
jgi:sterol desaturase/sphingolipid hydroxylase (fatty acid hydroxylase superfamily)